MAESPEQYRAVAAVFERRDEEVQGLERAVHELRSRAAAVTNPEAEVAAALRFADGLVECLSGTEDLALAGELFRRLNARLFLR